ncbi:MAG TPA: hypothetical protein VFY87_23970 [Geminicoccaceae bacterium]|nr:hypothetical protein [Geminicoccaceae bacterium]
MATTRPEHHIKVEMMCRPEERDLRHAARRALAEARADGRTAAALIDAATDAVAAVWAHIDREAIRAAVEAEARGQRPVLR